MYKRINMERKLLIDQTIEKINRLPDIKIKEVNDFIEFLLSKIDDQIITEGIQKIVSDSKSFDFFNEEESPYSTDDLKERYK